MREWTQTGRARFVAGDLLAPSLPDRSFDVVLSYRLLPHVRPLARAGGELCRLARRAVVVDYPTRRSVNAVADVFFGLKKGVEGNTRPFTVFSRRRDRAAFAAHGFAPTGRRPQFFFPMALHRGLGSAGLARGLEGAASGAGPARGPSAPPSS